MITIPPVSQPSCSARLAFWSAVLLIALQVSGCATLGAHLANREVAQTARKGCDRQEAIGPVPFEDCERVSQLIRKAGIDGGQVGFDGSGKLELRGDYANEDQVDLAFVIAQTIVGSALVSPITPRNVQMFRWYPVARPVVPATASGSGRKLALLVGISRFDNPGISAIEPADDDARTLSDSLVRGGFDSVRTLINEAATRDHILSELQSLEAQAGPNDLVLFYVSSHGAPPDKFGALNIIPYDAQLDAAAKALLKWDSNKDHSEDEVLGAARARYKMQRSAVPAAAIDRFVRTGKAARRVAILDVCYSGAALDAAVAPLGGSRYRTNENQAVRAVPREQISSMLGLSGAKDLVVEGDGSASSSATGWALGRYPGGDSSHAALPAAVEPSGTGLVVVTASSGKEKSRFDANHRTGIRNSYFTHFFAEGLALAGGNTRTAFIYAKPRTQQVVREIERESQTPDYHTNPDDNRLNLKLF